MNLSLFCHISSTSSVLFFLTVLFFAELSDGIQCVLHYDPDEILQCQLDGAIFNITSTSPNASTTSPENSSTLQKNKTTESQGGSSTSQNITSTSPEQSTSLNSKTTPITSSEITESEHDIQTSEGSTDMTANQPNGVILLKKIYSEINKYQCF